MKRIWYKIAKHAICRLTTGELHSLLREYREPLIVLRQDRESGVYMVTLETGKKYKLYYNSSDDSWHYLNPIKHCGNGNVINIYPNSVKTIIKINKIKTDFKMELAV